MGKLTYTRGTTYRITHSYTAPTYLGATLYFTVKTSEFNTDATDVSEAVMTPKTIVMSGSVFPQTTTITIAPTDVATSVEPGDYFYSIKVVDSNGDEYVVDSGQFILQAVTTNRT